MRKTAQELKSEFLKKLAREHLAACDDMKKRWAHRMAAVKKLAQEREDLLKECARLEDQVADAADVEYGGWEVWRTDPTLVDTVTERMEATTLALREKAETIRLEIESQQAQFDAAIYTLARTYTTRRRNLYL